jgi:hypothetical protein
LVANKIEEKKEFMKKGGEDEGKEKEKEGEGEEK